MISAFRMSGSQRTVILIEYNSELLNHVFKNWQGEIRLIIYQIEKPKISVYMVLQGLHNFLTRGRIT